MLLIRCRAFLVPSLRARCDNLSSRHIHPSCSCMPHLPVLTGSAGTPGDYNQWKALGNEGWGYEDVEPYFVKSEKTRSLPGSKYRGKNGTCCASFSPAFVLSQCCPLCTRPTGKSAVPCVAVQGRALVSMLSLWERLRRALSLHIRLPLFQGYWIFLTKLPSALEGWIRG